MLSKKLRMENLNYMNDFAGKGRRRALIIQKIFNQDNLNPNRDYTHLA